jgi:hypothetical protein
MWGSGTRVRVEASDLVETNDVDPAALSLKHRFYLRQDLAQARLVGRCHSLSRPDVFVVRVGRDLRISHQWSRRHRLLLHELAHRKRSQIEVI